MIIILLENNGCQSSGCTLAPTTNPDSAILVVQVPNCTVIQQFTGVSIGTEVVYSGV